MEKLLFKKIELWLVILGLMILLPPVGFWGIAFIKYRVFPHSIYREVRDFIKGDPMDESTLWKRIERDTINPMATWNYKYDITLSTDYKPVQLKGLDKRRDLPQLLLTGRQPDYRVLIGVLGMKDSLWGGLLLNAEGDVCHQWKLSGDDLVDNGKPEGSLYGTIVTPDGSIIYQKHTYGKGIIKRDFGSKIVWINKGVYHHAVSADENYEYLWTFGGHPTIPFPKLVKIDIETGKTLKTIAMEDVYRQNPQIHIFDHRMKDENTNMPHPNDIEILSSELAHAFPMFKAGDLAINYHTSSLIFVLDPETLKVKFWYMGAGDGAHDVDFQPNGTLTIFNNNYRVDWQGHKRPRYSDIVAVSPSEKKHWVVVSGEKANLYSKVNARHQFRGENRVVFDSSKQGRSTEVDTTTGEITFDFVNVYNREKETALFISESFHFSKDFFEPRIDTRTYTRQSSK